MVSLHFTEGESSVVLENRFISGSFFRERGPIPPPSAILPYCRDKGTTQCRFHPKGANMIELKIIELATKLTEKAMGTDSAVTTWIGNEEEVAKFLKTTVKTLDDLYNETH
jgi:hypothetical protein